MEFDVIHDFDKKFIDKYLEKLIMFQLKMMRRSLLSMKRCVYILFMNIQQIKNSVQNKKNMLKTQTETMMFAVEQKW